MAKAIEVLIFVSSTINNLAYIVPMLTNLLLFRSTMKKGPFSLNRFWGMIVNGISVLWLLFAIIFFSFPFEMPATGEYLEPIHSRIHDAND